MTPALGKKKQVDLCGFKASLVYRVITARATQRNPVSKKQKEKKRKSGSKWPSRG